MKSLMITMIKRGYTEILVNYLFNYASKIESFLPSIPELYIEKFVRNLIKKIPKENQGFYIDIFSKYISQNSTWKGMFTSKFIFMIVFELDEIKIIIDPFIKDKKLAIECLENVLNVWKEAHFVKYTSEKQHICKENFLT